MVKVNYDSGNSASLGYRPDDEFAAYGARVGSVHIKDRVRAAATVPLGTGDADFDALFDACEIGYDGDFVLQVARGSAGDEVAWARANREFVRRATGSRRRIAVDLHLGDMVALVAGSSRGIGRATARAFLGRRQHGP